MIQVVDTTDIVENIDEPVMNKSSGIFFFWFQIGCK